jgi:hypothetical protein
MSPQKFLSKWRNKIGSPVRKTILVLTLSLGTLAMTEGNTLPTSDSIAIPAEEVPLGKGLDFKDLPELPSLTLVDKNLNTIAKFYGDSKEIKIRFETTFKEAVFLMEYNGRKIYVIPSS